jgi:hypothetical protein
MRPQPCTQGSGAFAHFPASILLLSKLYNAAARLSRLVQLLLLQLPLPSALQGRRQHWHCRDGQQYQVWEMRHSEALVVLEQARISAECGQ